MGTRQRLGRCLHSAASRLQAIGGFWYRDRQRRTSEKLSGVEVSGLTEMECCSVPGDEAGAWPARVGHECSEVIGQVRIDRHWDHAIGIRTSNRSPMHSLPPGWWAQTNSPAVVSGSPESSGDLDHHRVQREGSRITKVATSGKSAANPTRFSARYSSLSPTFNPGHAHAGSGLATNASSWNCLCGSSDRRPTPPRLTWTPVSGEAQSN